MFQFCSLLALLLAASLSCSAPRNDQGAKAVNNQPFELLDSTAAAQAITTDKTDDYFDLVTISEMSIQLKKPVVPGRSRAEWVTEYVAFLKSDVADFTPSEAAFVTEVMRGIYENCQQLDPDIFPRNVRLIKTKGRHYGESVYYTRENCIVIPANELADRKREAFTSTMYHEVFHIYSRLNPEKQRALYKLIGFEPVGLKNLRLPNPLAERVLYNPDGVDFAQKITLRQGDTTIHAVPIIYANNVGYAPGKSEFFGYVEFSLFEIAPADGNNWNVMTTRNGYSSTLEMNKLPDFFRQIRDNTHYIIHPDEVLADNFSFLLRSRLDPKVTARFSPEGKELLKLMEAEIRN